MAVVLRIARLAVIGADEDAPAGDDGRGVRFRAQRRTPTDVLAGLHIEFLRQSLLRRHHVAGPCRAPLGLVGNGGDGEEQEGAENHAARHAVVRARRNAGPPRAAVAAASAA